MRKLVLLASECFASFAMEQFSLVPESCWDSGTEPFCGSAWTWLAASLGCWMLCIANIIISAWNPSDSLLRPVYPDTEFVGKEVVNAKHDMLDPTPHKPLPIELFQQDRKISKYDKRKRLLLLQAAIVVV